MSGISFGNFIERSIENVVSFIKESLFSDELASRNGLLQRIDPRMKFMTFMLFILCALFSHDIAVISYLYLLSLVFAVLSKINILFFIVRTWVFIPIFSLCIALPAIFNVFTPGEAVFTFKVMGVGLTVTRQGLSGASLFVMRVVTSVSFAVLLSITTKHFELLKVLRILRVPHIFVMILRISYRYIYLLAKTIEDTFLAVKSRAGINVRHDEGRHIVGWSIASLWCRSYQLNEEVYGAMVSRGYGGEPMVLDEFKIKTRDWLWLCVVVILCAMPLYFTR